MYILQYYKYSEDTNYRRLDCKNKTPSGRYNRKQFEFLGIQYPPKKG
jgi:hypothetical protein